MEDIEQNYFWDYLAKKDLDKDGLITFSEYTSYYCDLTDLQPY